jgi:multiple sugar transport system permease protein
MSQRSQVEEGQARLDHSARPWSCFGQLTGRNTIFLWMLAPVFVLLCLRIYVPVLQGILLAFRQYNMLNLSNTGFNGLANFSAVILDVHVSFLRILINTFVWVAASLILQFVLGFTLALLIRSPFPGRGLYASLVFYAWSLSGFAIGLIWAWLFNGQFGVANDVLLRAGLIERPIGFLSNPRFAMMSVIVANVWYGVPFFAIMLLAALQSVPRELYESAEVEGAGQVRQLFSITVPYVMPTIVSTLLLRTMWIMNFPDIIYGMTSGGPVNTTTILAIQMINKIFQEYDYGQGSAIGVIIMGILFIYAFFYLKVSARWEVRL